MTLIAEAPRRPQALTGPAAYALSLLYVAAATVAAVLMDDLTPVPNLSLVFVLPVVIAAVTLGWGPALAAAVAGVATFNFFLLAPRYTFHVADPANVWALLLLLATAAVVSAVAAQSRRRELQAWEAAGHAVALQALARNLVAATDRQAIATACAEALNQLFHAPAAIFLQTGEELSPAALAGEAQLSESDEEAARWALASKLPTRGGAYPVEAADYDVWPLVTRQRQGAAIAVKLSGPEGGRPASPERLVEIVAGYLAVALEREDLAAQALKTRVEIASERLKADLLAAVSHDLKTPLSTVLFTLQSLQAFAETHDPATRAELLSLAEKETARLSAMVGKLLDMNRLQAGAVAVRKAPVQPADLVAEALARVGVALAGRPVINEVSGRRQPLLVDADLFESALGNVLENAGKYAPPGSPIRVRSGVAGEVGWIDVLDEGPGFAASWKPRAAGWRRRTAATRRARGCGCRRRWR